MDRHRLGYFTTGGKFVTAFDLSPTDKSVAAIRDTFAVTPPPQQAITTKASRRYGGERKVGEAHGNGQLSAEFYIRAGSQKASLARLDALLDVLEDARTQYYWEWRPDGATYSTYFEVRDNVFEPQYKWVEFNYVGHFHLRLAVTVAPLALGDPYDIYDDFARTAGMMGTPLYTNLIPNPSGDVDQSSWANLGMATFAQQAPGSNLVGAGSFRYISGTLGVAGQVEAIPMLGGSTQLLPVKPGETYTLKAMMMVGAKTGTASAYVQLNWYDASGGFISGLAGNQLTSPISYTASTVTVTIPANGAYLEVFIVNNGGASGGSIEGYFDAVQLTQTSTAPAYFDGDSDNALWNGTRHNSTSTFYTGSKFEDYALINPSGVSNPIMTGSTVKLGDISSPHFLTHTGRGYSYTDAQITVKVITGSNPGGHALIGMQAGTNEFLLGGNAYGVGGVSVQRYYGGGTLGTTNLSVAGTTMAASTTYWIRFRREGSSITVEQWTTDPALSGSASQTNTITLSSGDLQTFATWRPAMYLWNAAAYNWSWDDFVVEPFTYGSKTWPTSVTLSGVPGTAPAKFDAVINATANGAAFGLLAWGKKPGTPSTGVAPFGVINASTASSVTGFTVTANGSAFGGNSLNSNSGLTSLRANWLLDPSTLVSDEFQKTVDVELWAHMDVNSAMTSLRVTPFFSKYAEGSPYEPWVFTYTQEFGSAGKTVTLPTGGGTRMRLYRLGTLTLPVNATSGTLALDFAPQTATTTTSIIMNYLVLVPARQRAASPTGKIGTWPDYPWFMSQVPSTKRVTSELAGFLGPSSFGSFGAPDTGLGGQMLEMAPGDNRVVYLPNPQVPDDPTVTGGGNLGTQTASLHIAIQPRYFLTRSG